MTGTVTRRPEAGRAEVSAVRAAVRAALSGVDDAEVDRWERDGHLPRAVLAGLGEADVFRRRWAAGAEEGLPLLAAVSEETSAVCSGLALAVLGHCEIFTGALAWLADTPGQQALLADALGGRALGCFAATEEHGGSDLAGVRTVATPRPGGGWRLTGAKRYVSNLGGATHAVVLARVAGRPRSSDLALLLLPLDAPGVEVTGFFPTVGLRSCDVGAMRIDTELQPDALLGAPGLGLAYASRLLQFERIAICVQLVAGAGRALRLAAAYARRRETGGVRLLDRQAVRHRLAGHQAELWAVEGALRAVLEDAAAGLAVSHRVAGLKLVATRMAEEVTDGCLQVFGARGYTTNFPLERWWRDTRLARIGGGADEVMSDAVASFLDRRAPVEDETLDRLEAADQPFSPTRG